LDDENEEDQKKKKKDKRPTKIEVSHSYQINH
jgi:hypothetical protein